MKDWKRLDPYYSREAERYSKPIPSREFILKVLMDEKLPMTLEQLAGLFGIRDEEMVENLRRRLNAMVRDGQLIQNRRGAYLPVDERELVRGRVVAHPDGFGFLVPDEGGQDIYLPPREMRMLLHGDRAVVRIAGLDRRGRKEGVVIQVLERNTHQVVGRLIKEKGIAVVAPHHKRIHLDIIIPPEYQNGAEPGHIVEAEIIQQPDRHAPPVGKVVNVLGRHMAPGMEIDIAIRAFELPHVWPVEVEREVAGIQKRLPKKEKERREDIRHLPLVTIDGADAKDFDDAVFAERQGRGWRLLVAIADVSWYVRKGSALDEEAQNRGNSVYFPGRVVPMLPEILSNDLCSLKPKVDRFCMVCEMHFTATGKVREHHFYPGLMRSHARLIYEDVAAALKGDKRLRQRYRHLMPHLEDLHALYRVLRKERERRGAIDFETTETRIIFGPGQKIERIVPVERTDAHRMIEEFMIAANVASAKTLLDVRIPALYRVHEGPSPDKVEELRAFLAEFGLKLGGGDQPQPRHFAQLLQTARGRPEAALIQTVILRSMSQAIYTPENRGHFGLALEAYTHFTSPIRRYPDLIVHRALRHLLEERPVETYPYTPAQLENIGDHCSMTERRADEATRDAVDWLKCEYMMDKVGEVFPGIITGVTSFGLFVSLKDIYVEGLAHITTLGNDYYHFDPVKHRLVGERTGRVYRLGDEVKVKVVRVDLDEKEIDFELVEGGKGRGRRRRR
ncbi:MAG: ribonuclease R [Gammaproteobacteria bacterium]|nr:MAG: ribonuclease R [Gammaproteobacteria bacterium]